MDEGIHEFASGAVRSNEGDDMRFDLICPTALMRLARVYGEGAAKYGDTNWTLGMDQGIVINHLTHHLLKWSSGDRQEDHLAKVAWGAFALMHFSEMCQHQVFVKMRAAQDEGYRLGSYNGP